MARKDYNRPMKKVTLANGDVLVFVRSEGKIRMSRYAGYALDCIKFRKRNLQAVR